MKFTEVLAFLLAFVPPIVFMIWALVYDRRQWKK